MSTEQTKMSSPNCNEMEREEVEMKILDMKNEGMLMRSMRSMFMVRDEVTSNNGGEVVKSTIMVRDEVKAKKENDALILLKREKLIQDIERRIEQNKMLKALETSGFSYVGGNMISIPKSVRRSREVYPKGSWWG